MPSPNGMRLRHQDDAVQAVFGQHIDKILDERARVKKDNRNPDEWLVVLIGPLDELTIRAAYNSESLDGCRLLGLPVHVVTTLAPGTVLVHERDPMIIPKEGK